MFRPNPKGKIPADLTGQQFGQWAVLRFAGYDHSGQFILWLCQCSCGTESKVATAELKLGKSYRCKKCGNKAAGLARRLQPFESVYRVLLANSKNRGIEVSLSYEDFFEFVTNPSNAACSYCNVPLLWTEHTANDRWASRASHLDRLDNTKGYSKDNCVPCCYRCNSVRGAFLTAEQMKQVGLLIQQWEGTRV